MSALSPQSNCWLFDMNAPHAARWSPNGKSAASLSNPKQGASFLACPWLKRTACKCTGKQIICSACLVLNTRLFWIKQRTATKLPAVDVFFHVDSGFFTICHIFANCHQSYSKRRFNQWSRACRLPVVFFCWDCFQLSPHNRWIIYWECKPHGLHTFSNRLYCLALQYDETIDSAIPEYDKVYLDALDGEVEIPEAKPNTMG